MIFHYINGQWLQYKPKTYNVYTKINGKLCKWVDDNCRSFQDAAVGVKHELGLRHRAAIMVVVK